MICSDDVFRVIRNRFRVEVETPYPDDFDVIYDNEDADRVPEEGTTWCRWTVLPGDSQLVSIGSTPRYRSWGLAVASIFVPINTGTKAANEIAHRIIAAFRTVTDQCVKFRVPRITHIGRSGRFHQVNVTCPYESDEIRGYPFTKGFSGGFEAYG